MRALTIWRSRSARAAAKGFRNVHELVTATVYEMSELVIGEHHVAVICGSVPTPVVGKVSEAIIKRTLPLIHPSKREPVCNRVATALVFLDNTLGGYVPQSWLARPLRTLVSVNPVSGALNLSGIYELQGLPVERAIPAAVEQAAPQVILSLRKCNFSK